MFLRGYIRREVLSYEKNIFVFILLVEKLCFIKKID